MRVKCLLLLASLVVTPAFAQSSQTPADLHAQLCTDMASLSAARLDSLKAKLALTSDQSEAFARWESLKLTQQKSACLSGASAAGAKADRSPLDRLTGKEAMFQARLDDVKAERPVLADLYEKLTDSQIFVTHHGF